MEQPGLEPGTAELREALDRVLAANDLTERRNALARLSVLIFRRTGRLAGQLARGGRPVLDLVVDLVQDLPARDEAALRSAFPGQSPAEVAAALTRTAVRVTAAVGAAGGGLAAAEWVALPALAAVPAQVVAETVVVALVELRLVAEIHAAYGVVPAGSAAQRGTAYLQSWARRRGIDATQLASLPTALGVAGRKEVGQRLARRFLRNSGTVAPMLIGAAVGAELNRRETSRLGKALIEDLGRTLDGQ